LPRFRSKAASKCYLLNKQQLFICSTWLLNFSEFSANVQIHFVLVNYIHEIQFVSGGYAIVLSLRVFDSIAMTLDEKTKKKLATLEATLVSLDRSSELDYYFKKL
jgi:hypothetical protein